MNQLELKVPPLVVALACGLLIWIASATFSSLSFSIRGIKGLAILFGVIGIVAIVVAIRTFRKAKTTVDPRKPDTATSLVQSGIYNHSRNPIYLGLLFILIGFAVYVHNYIGFVFLPLFVIYMNRFQIRPEEKALESLFGQDFQNYKRRVRRWA